jgi:large subunit ribosomal protein L4
MPKKMRQAALRSALSAKAAEAGVVLVDDLKMDEARTRMMAATLSNLVGKSTALIVMPAKDKSYDAVMRSTDNLAEAKVLLASYLNIRDLLGFDKVILPVKVVDTLVARLG